MLGYTLGAENCRKGLCLYATCAYLYIKVMSKVNMAERKGSYNGKHENILHREVQSPKRSL